MKFLLVIFALALGVGGARQAQAQCKPSSNNYGHSTRNHFQPAHEQGCGFPDGLRGIPSVAISTKRFDASGFCGACVEVTGYNPDHTVYGTPTMFMVRDECPECLVNQLDIDWQVGSQYIGRFNVPNGVPGVRPGTSPTSFKVVPCPFRDPVRFALKNDPNKYWSAVQVSNTRYVLQKLEYKHNGSFVNLPRASYNYFPLSLPGGSADLHGKTATFRLTDENGNTIVETVRFSSVITLNGYQGPLVEGQSNFPDCANHRALSGAAAAAEPGELVPSQHPLGVWPNPATGTVRLSWTDLNHEPVQLTIVNAQGVVMERQLVNSLSSYQFDTTNLPDGVYHVSMQAGKATNYTKLLVKH